LKVQIKTPKVDLRLKKGKNAKKKTSFSTEERKKRKMESYFKSETIPILKDH
jgi:hypothetical protein